MATKKTSNTATKQPARKAAKTVKKVRSKVSANGSEQKSSRTRVNGAAGRATASPRAAATRRPRTTEKTAVKELAVQTAQDYAQAKKALGALWEDVAQTTYTAFNTIANKVEKRYAESRKAISDLDVRYALEKTGEKLKSVKNSASATAQHVAKQVKLLYQMLKDSTSGKFKAPWATIAAITAALLYFVSPVDLLPDFIPGAGLIDDALVLSLCISVIRMDLRRYAKENNLDLAQYGLAKERT